MPKKFWKNKILITGIDGFVGSNLAKRLTGLGANVSGIIQKKIHYILGQYIKSKLFKGEITNKSFIQNIINKNNFEIVFHLAAQVEVGVVTKSL